MRNPHEHDRRPAEYEEWDRHADDCSCDVHAEAYDHEDEVVPSQAELERRFQYFMRKGA
jgi:hypothetical protein